MSTPLGRTFGRRDVSFILCYVVTRCVDVHVTTLCNISLQPYSLKQEDIRHSNERNYYPISGKLSSGARALVKQMLTKDPADRITIAEILEDPWFETPSETMVYESGHVNRLASCFELQRKMKMIFAQNEVEAEFKAVRNQASSANMCVPCSPTIAVASTASLEDKLQDLKDRLVNLVRSDEITSSDNSPSSNKRRKFIHDGSIDYIKYAELMTDSGLGDLYGNEQSFQLLFDRDNSGTVDLKEFLVTLLALSPAVSEADQVNAATLYFKLCDINKDGHIDKEELELVLNCLLDDGTGALLRTADTTLDFDNIENLFGDIDTDRDGKISLQEFTIFYQKMMSSSLTLNQSVSTRSAAST
jgi:Ca2+-binding EF-hand superfamily protein